jgi:tetraacyldisaccharide 4'-kinase
MLFFAEGFEKDWSSVSNRWEQFESYALGVIEGRERGKRAAVLRWVLRQLARIFAVLVQFRLRLYRWGILRPRTLGCQVLSVGNLTVGGTGKTPVVEVFARSLQEQGRKVAILSRGYKRIKAPFWERLKIRFRVGGAKRPPPLVVSDGERLLLDSATSGDEPYMLASNLPKVAVIVDKDRVHAGQYAIRKLGCDTLILDDGFQYLKMKHRLDIVLVDRTNPFGNGHVLPRGILREKIKNIRRAGFIFITKSNGDGAPELKKRLRELNPHAEISECRHCARYIQDVFSGDQYPLSKLNGMKVFAVSAIAVPQGFEYELKRLGADVIYHQTYADHHRYTQQEIIDAINRSLEKGADALLTTEKDAVRFPLIERRDIPVYFLRVEIEMLSGADAFYEWIARICYRPMEGATWPRLEAR